MSDDLTASCDDVLKPYSLVGWVPRRYAAAAMARALVVMTMPHRSELDAIDHALAAARGEDR